MLLLQRDGESWKFCLAGLADPSTDDHLKLFFFHCLENVIYQRWFQLNTYDKKTIRDHIWALFRNSNTASRVQRNKLAQLIAIFGKRQFPTGEHEEYDKQIKLLLEDRSTFILGVILLRANCEEIVNTRSDVTIMTRDSFSQAMAKCLISFVPILNQSLLVIIDRNATDSSEFLQFATEIFSCIQAIIQCDLIEDHYLSNIVSDLFTIARSDPRIAFLAMETLTELFTRQRMFRGHDIVAKGVVELLRVADKTNEIVLISLLQTMSKHLTADWWSKVSICSVENYLELLWSFTTKSEEPSSFSEKLTIWTPILNYYSENVVSASPVPESLINVAKLTLNRISLQYNSQLVEIYDNEVASEDSDWSIFLRQCLDTFAIISQIQPLAVFDLICTEIGKPHGPLDIFGNLVHKTHTMFLNVLNDAQNTDYLRLMLRDLGTQSQVLARSLPAIKANLEDEVSLTRVDEIITRVIEVSHLLLAHIAQIAPGHLVLFEDLINA